MILFATSTDAATQRCRAVAELLRLHAEVEALDESACASRLEEALSIHPGDLLAMSHGGPDRITGQDGLAALSTTNAHFASGRTVFAFACSTAEALGERAVMEGARAYWGYVETVLLPDGEDVEPDRLLGLFDIVRGPAMEAQAVVDVEDVMVRIREECKRLEKELADRSTEQGTRPLIESYAALRFFWHRLGCWLPGGDEIVRHPNLDAIV